MPKNIVVQTRVSEDVYKKFKQICRKNKVTVSAAIRDLILKNVMDYYLTGDLK